MGQKLSPEQMELYRRVDEVLHYLWDPIGVSGAPEARDEYRGYLQHVFSLLVNGAPEAEIIDFLVKTVTETMGLSSTQLAANRAREIASLLTKHRDFIHKRNIEGW
jgi:hypothetical protein